MEIKVILSKSKGTIRPTIYGHFSEHIGGVINGGLWVGEDSNVPNIRGFRKALVESFAKLNPPVLRWPGGCFAETYDWRDGIGPRSQRPRRINWWYNNDHRVEMNQVGTHEFVDFCRMVGAEPYFAANMTSVTPLHIRNWIEYCNAPAHLTTLADERAENGSVEPFNVKYWGIGNENWGGGGNMTAEMCAREYMRYSTICRSIPGDMKLVACGADAHDITWTRELMRTMQLKRIKPDAVAIHYYCGTAGKPAEFSEKQWYELLNRAGYMRNIVDDHRAAMDEFDPERSVGMFIDEWGCWHQDGTGPSNGYNLFEQQSNMRDAVVAALTLNIFNNRCDTVEMANVAQLCNNLHSLYLADGENFVETPNYHVFDMFKTHQGAKQLEIINNCGEFAPVELPGRVMKPLERVSASASVNAEGIITVTMANTSLTESADVRLSAIDGSLTGAAQVITLSSADPHTCNTFECPDAVRPVKTDIRFNDGDSIHIPAAGIVTVLVHTSELR